MKKISVVKPPKYPSVHRVNKTWSYRSAKAKGNVTYADPYYWLEATGKNTEIQNFVSDQTKVTEDYIKGCKNKDKIDASLLEASTFDKYTQMALISSNKDGAMAR